MNGVKKRYVSWGEMEVIRYEKEALKMGYCLITAQDYASFKKWFDEQERKQYMQQLSKKQQKEKTTVGKAVITLTTPFFVDDEFERSRDYGTADHESLILSLF